MSTGYKRSLLKSPLSCYLDEIRGYPTDVVETCIATPYGFGASNCQSYQEKVQLGSSIGIIKPQGTLSAVVHDRNSKKIGILSCEHVCRFSNSRVLYFISPPIKI
jgi:hypothetical protein